MQSFFRLLFTGLVMLLFLGALEDSSGRNGYADPVCASPVHPPEAEILLPLNRTQLMENAPPVLSLEAPWAVHMNQRDSRHVECMTSGKLKETVSVYMEIKRDLSLRTGCCPIRIPDQRPEGPPYDCYT